MLPTPISSVSLDFQFSLDDSGDLSLSNWSCEIEMACWWYDLEDVQNLWEALRHEQRLITVLFIWLWRHHLDIHGTSERITQKKKKFRYPYVLWKPFDFLTAKCLFFICREAEWWLQQVFLQLLFFLSPGRSEGGYKPCRHEKSPSKVNEVISPEVLKMRAALFCIFTYLDTKTLLRAAEVCRDWKFVARHPAVWTRVLLENARISSKVFNTIHTGHCSTPVTFGQWPPSFI